MTRRPSCLLSLAVVLACPALRAQDILFEAITEKMVVSSKTIDLTDSKTLKAPVASPIYLAVYSYAKTGNKGPCKVDPGWKVQLKQAGSAYLEVTIGAPVVVVSNAVPFQAVDGTDGYKSYALPGYKGTEFHVMDGGRTERCASELGTSFDATYQFLRISADSTVAAFSTPILSDDLPIPIIGSSLKLMAPPGTKFDCGGTTYSATLTGAKKTVASVNKTVKGRPAEMHVNLESASDWMITAYPHELRIWPGWGTTMKFSMPKPGTFDCGDGTYLDLGTATKPQSFVVDWSPGWFSARRSVQVPCRECFLWLIKKK